VFAKMGHRIQNQFSGIGVLKAFLAILLPSVFEFLNLKVIDRTANDFFANVIRKTIKHREDTGEKRNEFLQCLMDSRSGNLSMEDDDLPEDNFDSNKKLAVNLHSNISQDPKPSKMVFTEELIVAQCALLFFAGLDTTETLLIFAAYELALNPDVQERLAKDLEAVKNNGGDLSYDVVNGLEYLDIVISDKL